MKKNCIDSEKKTRVLDVLLLSDDGDGCGGKVENYTYHDKFCDFLNSLLALSRARRPLAKKSTFVCYINACVFERVPTSHLSPHAIINCFRERRLGRFFLCCLSSIVVVRLCGPLALLFRKGRASEREMYDDVCGGVWTSKRERTGEGGWGENKARSRSRREKGLEEKMIFISHCRCCCCERVSRASLWNENEMFSLLQRRFCRFFLLPLPLYSIAAYMLARLPMVKCEGNARCALWVWMNGSCENNEHVVWDGSNNIIFFPLAFRPGLPHTACLRSIRHLSLTMPMIRKGAR